MWTFRDKEDLKGFLAGREDEITCIYLDDGLDARILKNIHNAKAGFDRRVGSKWHMLLPHKSGRMIPDMGGYRGYNFDLALSLAEEFDVDPRDLPVMVFTDPSQNDAVFVVSFAGLANEKVTQLIREIAHVTTKPREAIGEKAAEAQEVLAEIRALMADQGLIKAFPIVGSLTSGFARMMI